MSFKYNAGTLKKLEGVFEEARYIVRYEKGNFNAGHCLLEDKRIVVINKFFNLENKINCLIDIIQTLDFRQIEFSEEIKSFYKKIMANKLLEVDDNE
jgi:hypothetical protein